MYTMEVQELLRICLQHDRKGEKLLYERYVSMMAGLCRRYLKYEPDVQDVLMEGFVKVFDKLRTFEYRGEQSLEVWIRRIMINECLMRLRKKENRFFADAFSEPAHGETKEILMLMQSLPIGYRTVLNLYVIDGFSHKEIAGMLGITESASRSQLTHARTKLKELLKLHGWNGMIK